MVKTLWFYKNDRIYARSIKALTKIDLLLVVIGHLCLPFLAGAAGAGHTLFHLALDYGYLKRNVIMWGIGVWPGNLQGDSWGKRGENVITYRKVKPEDIYPAFELALRVFIEYEAPDYEPDAIGKFRSSCTDNEDYIGNYVTGKHLMYVALEGEKIIGFVNERGNGHISMLFVDGLYHRQGIATALMNNIVCQLKLRGFDKITVNSSPYGLPFYKHFGFKPTDTVQKKDGFVFIPMSYEPKEIWDIYDKNRNKTGRYAERGRKMADGDYHLVVHVWKRNSKGEWLIDRRALGRGTDIDGKWETTGGSALAGNDSLATALRETKEELGIDLDPQRGVLFRTTTRHVNGRLTWLDAWVFEHNCPIEDVRLQEGETCDAMWASTDKIREMMAAGEFLGESFYPYFEEMVKEWDVSRGCFA